jgi:RNA polymerase sigma-70 factor (ECF subfamily)
MVREDADHTLLEAARAGDRNALGALLDRHQAEVYRFGLRMCRDPEDARDVLQETLLAMARGVRDFRGASSVSTWAYAIARSHCIKKRRKRGIVPGDRVPLDDDTAGEARAVADPERSPEETLEGKEIERALERAIDELHPDQREVLVLRDVEGLTAPEVAEVLGITVQAVKSRLHRARLAVRDRVGPLLVPTMPAEPASGSAPGACPDVLTLFSQHLEDEISADVCSAMERHLEGCARCRTSCDALKRTLAMCRTLGPQAPVPPAVQAAVRIALRDVLATAAGPREEDSTPG